MSSSYKHPRTEVAFEHDVDRAIKLLRVSKGVTKQEIEKSFRKLALTLHPDKTSDRKANERFPEAFNAKELLLNNLDFLAKLARVDRERKFLRVSKDATKEEIENSFRQLAKTLHPDKTSDLKAHERLLEAINAKELLLHHFEKEFGKLSKIFEERFEKIHEWLQRNEDDSKLLKTAITYQRRRRQTNLHFILERNPPIGIIQKLIKYAPEALQMSDVSDRLPIHTACGRSNSCDVIQTLVKGYPESIKVTDSSGCLPLHHAIRSQASWKIVSFLIDCFPEGVGESHLIPFYEGNLYPNERQTRPPLYFLKIYKYAEKKDRKGMLLLHRACKMNEFSADLVCVLDEAYPESWTIPDNYGKTPKQYLIESASRKDERGMLLLHRQAVHFKGLSVKSLNMLFDAYPEAIRMQDDSGLLPIHHACLNESSSLDVLLSLFQLYPESIAGDQACSREKPNMNEIDPPVAFSNASSTSAHAERMREIEISSLLRKEKFEYLKMKQELRNSGLSETEIETEFTFSAGVALSGEEKSLLRKEKFEFLKMKQELRNSGLSETEIETEFTYSSG